MEDEVLNRELLKIRALQESLANTVGNYENRIADMRVDATVQQSHAEQMIRDLTNEVRRLQTENDELSDENQELKEGYEDVEEEDPRTDPSD